MAESWFKRWTPGGKAAEPSARPSVQRPGMAAEDRALAHLQAQGLGLVERNYRVARGPGRPGGEIDLIMRDGQTLVFIEVRSRRAGSAHGGAAASVGAAKRARIIHAARHYLLRDPDPPPCRFDLVAIDGESLNWLQAAFDTG
ncbi:YraN family protein [Leptothrix sp. BB-4]